MKGTTKQVLQSAAGRYGAIALTEGQMSAYDAAASTYKETRNANNYAAVLDVLGWPKDAIEWHLANPGAQQVVFIHEHEPVSEIARKEDLLDLDPGPDHIPFRKRLKGIDHACRTLPARLATYGISEALEGGGISNEAKAIRDRLSRMQSATPAKAIEHAFEAGLLIAQLKNKPALDARAKQKTRQTDEASNLVTAENLKRAKAAHDAYERIKARHPDLREEEIIKRVGREPGVARVVIDEWNETKTSHPVGKSRVYALLKLHRDRVSSGN